MTITLRTESTGVRPEFEHLEVLGRRALRSAYGPQAIRVRTIAPNTKSPVPTNVFDVRRWKLMWTNAQYGQWRQLHDIWNESYGGTLPMDYTPVGELDVDAVEVTFVEGSFEHERTGLLTYSMSVEIEELR